MKGLISKQREIFLPKKQLPLIQENETAEQYFDRLDRFQLLEVDSDDVIRATGQGARQVQPLLSKMIHSKWEIPNHLKGEEVLDGKDAASLSESMRTYELETGDLVAAATDKGINYKDWNEDRVGVDPYANSVYVVDGMGGQGEKGAGKKAANLLVKSLIDHPGNPQKGVERCIYKMKKTNMDGGACFASVRINKNQSGEKEALVTRIGDVKALVIRNNEVVYESVDESKTQKKLDAGIINPEEALYDEERHKVMNSVMSPFYMDTKNNESETVPVQKGDFIIVMSDGISDNLTSKENAKWCRGAKTPELIVETLSRLTDAQMKNGGISKMPGKPDNRGIAVIQIS